MEGGGWWRGGGGGLVEVAFIEDKRPKYQILQESQGNVHV